MLEYSRRGIFGAATWCKGGAEAIFNVDVAEAGETPRVPNLDGAFRRRQK